MNYHYKEENNYPKAFLATGIILAAIIALCYFIVFRDPPVPLEGTGGILVNYGTTDEGMGKDQMSVDEPSVAEKANHTQPTKVTEAPPTEQKTVVDNSDKKIVTQDVEDAAAVTTNAKKPSPVVATQPNKPAAKPVVNQNALYTGSKASKGTGGGDGTTNTPGNQGSKNGSNLAPNYGEGGSGAGLKGLPQWSFATPLNVSNTSRTAGIVIIDITVDPNGNVVDARADRKTRMADLALIQRCVDIVKASKLTSSSPANGNQSGQVNFIFNID